MKYGQVRKLLRDTDKIELFVKTKKDSHIKIYFVRDTKKFDNLKVNFIGSQKSIMNNEKMLVADLYE